MSDGGSAPRPTSAPPGATWRRRVAAGLAVGLFVLAITETVSALVAPLLAPSEADWRGAAATVHSGFRQGDLLVAAPSWSDQVMRLHLGDLVPLEVATRLDDARFARVWEIAQRGAHAPEGHNARLVQERRHGALTVRLYEKPAVPVLFDFVAQVDRARVVRPGTPESRCPRVGARFQCPDNPGSFVQPRVLETGFELHRGLLIPAVARTAIEWTDVPLGRELAVGSGLHSVWQRRHTVGPGRLRVIVDGRELGTQLATARNGWQVVRYDTSDWAGKRAVVRFEVSAERPLAVLLGFAAEARGK